ncbi:MAG TPA: Tat pathway signal protein, partial [Verrucomicrobiae bacterium]
MRITGSAMGGLLLLASFALTQPRASAATGANLAAVATPSSSHTSGDTTVDALNDGFTPARSLDDSHRSYGNWPRRGTQWVQYEWTQPISTKQIEVYWWDDRRGVRLPKACRVKYWDGKELVAVANASGLGVAGDKFNVTTFDEVTTTRLRLEMDSDGEFSTGVLEWRVLDSGKSPAFPPGVVAGVDRSVMLNGKTYLSGAVRSLQADPTVTRLAWTKAAGPGDVTFANPKALETTATFSAPGDYTLKLTATEGALSSASTLKVRVCIPPPADRLDVVYTKRYTINSPFWSARAKALIVNWIPHCVDYINRTNLTQGEGGIDNFIEAAKALRGEPHGRHKGYVFANAWVHQTIESICLALMVDPQGDAEIIQAQAQLRATMEDWIPKILAAQEPDGYLQTAYT